MQPYDRACSLLPFLRAETAAAAAAGAPWAQRVSLTLTLTPNP